MTILHRFKDLMQDIARPTVLEFGAHNGHHTGLLASAIGTKPYRMFAFEPDERQIPHLKTATQSHNVTIVQSAVGAVDSDAVPFWVSDGVQQRPGDGHGQRFNGSSSIRTPTEHNARAFPEMQFEQSACRCTRFDTFAREQAIGTVDFIWADIQGAEVDLIAGGTEALKRTRYLYTEYCDGELYAGEIGLAKILELLPEWEVVEDYGGDALLRNTAIERREATRPVLSVLVCTLNIREDYLHRIRTMLIPQFAAAPETELPPERGWRRSANSFQLLIDKDNGEVSIGVKRQRLLEAARGRYICFIDDDDTIHPRYVELILNACRTGADCVGFRLRYSVDGKDNGECHHTFNYERYRTQKSLGRMNFYERTPNHINPVRRELALATGFSDMQSGEDSDYATRLYPLLKSEAFVDEYLYNYEYRSERKRVEAMAGAGSRA